MAECKSYHSIVDDSDDKERKAKHYPWYKERLRTKYVKKLKPGQTLSALDSKNWVKLRPRMDDFRDGYPPDFDGIYYLRGNKGLSPNLVGKGKDTFAKRLQDNGYESNKQRPFLTREQRQFDTKLPLMKMRHDHIEQVEHGLTQHPLALYPHLEEGMPPELFDELVDILDPAMNPDEDSMEETMSQRSNATVDSQIIMEKDSNKGSVEGRGEREVGGSVAGSERLQEEEEEEVEEEEEDSPFTWMKSMHKKKKDTPPPPQDDHIKQVTRDFCKWVSDLGGESNNIEESTVMSLFASGYETKPALSVPIHVVELSYIPAELRETAGMQQQDAAATSTGVGGAATSGGKQSRETSAAASRGGRRKKADHGGGYEPSWAGPTTYGAWYLRPQLWKVAPRGQPLEDPKEVEKREQSESRMKSHAMHKELSGIHGSRAFREFLERKQRRMPDFMTKVARMQDREDEEARRNAPPPASGVALQRGGGSRATTKRSQSSMTHGSTISFNA